MRESSRTTQVMITRIKRLLLETGLLTGEHFLCRSISSAQFSFVAALWETAYPLLTGVMGINAFTILGLSLCKIYSNSILVLLNSRFVIVGGRNKRSLEFEADPFPLTDVLRSENAEHGIRE